MIKHVLVMNIGANCQSLWDHYTETNGLGHKNFGRFIAAMTNAKVTGSIMNNYLLKFANEKDYVMFKLKWS